MPITRSDQQAQLRQLRRGDTDLYNAWKKRPGPTTLRPLLHNLNPLIQREVNRWQGTLARPYLELQAKKLAVEAINTYDPHRNVQLSTHVTNRLQKLSRPNYTYRRVARIPEHRVVKLITFEGVRDRMTDDLGREPTMQEMSEELGWGIPAIQRYNREAHRELLTEQEGPEEEPGVMDNVIHYIYHDLTPVQQKIFEMKTGYMGQPVSKPADIRKKLKLSQGQLSYQQSQILNQFEKAGL